MSRIDVNILKQIGNDVGMDMYDSLIEIFYFRFKRASRITEKPV